MDDDEKSASLEKDGNASNEDLARKPLYVYPLLLTAIVAVSTAGVGFASMKEIPPFLLSAWRLQITAILLVPLGVLQILKFSPEDRWKMLKQSHLLAASGVLLCLHYKAWVEAIETTSLPHAMLGASSPPLLIALGTWILRKPISIGELTGTGIAIGGMVILTTQGIASEKEVTLYGDIMSVVGAALFVVYLLIGRKLRAWMPTFAYVLPVNMTAAISLSCMAMLVEGAHFDGSQHGIFGQFTAWPYFWRCFYMGAVPGILGHVSFNLLLAWLHPLIIALPGTMEAPIGAFIGYGFGVAAAPGWPTYMGGTVLILSTVLVILSSYQREKAEKAANLKYEIETIDLELAAEIGEVPDETDKLIPKSELDELPVNTK